MSFTKTFNKPWVFLALALVAVFMENCDSDTVRGFRHIMRAKNAAKMVKKFPVKVIRRPVMIHRKELAQQIQVPAEVTAGNGGVHGGASSGSYGEAPNSAAYGGASPGGYIAIQAVPSGGAVHAGSHNGGAHAAGQPSQGHGESNGGVLMGGYGGQITLQEGAMNQEGWGMPIMHAQEIHSEHKGWGWNEPEQGHKEHEESKGWGWKEEEEHKGQMGWGWKEKKKNEHKHDGKDIIASIIGIKILKIGKYIVLSALAILILVLAAIATAGILVSPLSLPLHAFWIGLLFLIPFCPLFILAFIAVALKDILTHIRYEEEEEEHHGWGWTGGSERWKRSVIFNQPVWQLHRNIMHAMKKLPDFDNFENSKFI